LSIEPPWLYQTVRDQAGRAFEELLIFVPKSVRLFTLGIEHSENLFMLIHHRNNDFRPRGVKGRQMARILAYVADNNRYRVVAFQPEFRFERAFETMALACGKIRATQALCRFNRATSPRT
jgi:hypothetical protein